MFNAQADRASACRNMPFIVMFCTKSQKSKWDLTCNHDNHGRKIATLQICPVGASLALQPNPLTPLRSLASLQCFGIFHGSRVQVGGMLQDCDLLVIFFSGYVEFTEFSWCFFVRLRLCTCVWQKLNCLASPCPSQSLLSLHIYIYKIRSVIPRQLQEIASKL
jgi:hypothetical protein